MTRADVKAKVAGFPIISQKGKLRALPVQATRQAVIRPLSDSCFIREGFDGLADTSRQLLGSKWSSTAWIRG
jgi:hypothetical protein